MMLAQQSWGVVTATDEKALANDIATLPHPDSPAGVWKMLASGNAEGTGGEGEQGRICTRTWRGHRDWPLGKSHGAPGRRSRETVQRFAASKVENSKETLHKLPDRDSVYI